MTDHKSMIDPEGNILSVGEIIIKIQTFIHFLKKRWYALFLTFLITSILGFFYSKKQKTIYSATLTFALEDEKSNGLAGAMGIASTFGFDIGSGNGGGAFSAPNLAELMKSRTLIEKVLLNPIEQNGNFVSLADYYLQFKGYKHKWKDEKSLDTLTFGVFSDKNKFTRTQDSVMGLLYESIIFPGSGLIIYQKEKKASILAIEFHSEDEIFAKAFVEYVAKEVSELYIETKSKKAKLNVQVLEKQVDSIRNELNAAISGVAVANDNTFNLNPALLKKKTPGVRRQIDVQANTAILTQLVANLEMARVTLLKETPLIQIIDKPVLPLKREKISTLKTTIGAGIFGVLFIVFLYGGRFLIQSLIVSARLEANKNKNNSI
ncbi:hypothetical protein KACHI17_12660 [Sediminibacterium sp. KACHI17]|uniref:Lipopolysaccharide biosynthesis protein n=1 Tax=Sediminibacterium sp. KACHI17 TaxID=1751071 RepID=A0AAT9GIE3_9BACT